jgi:hypothetical protein
MTKRNPKQDGSVLYDCVPQAGKCPRGCNQCFFNRPGAFYTETPSIPEPATLPPGAIVRMNCGHDSNIEKSLVERTALYYERFFFNTSIPRFDFIGPVVFTANPREEEPAWTLPQDSLVPANLMFVRLRVSGTNLKLIDQAVWEWTLVEVPVVLTFMAYYSQTPQVDEQEVGLLAGDCYEYRKRILNAYYCPTYKFVEAVMKRYYDQRLVTTCGGLCKDCRNCETYYIQTRKRMNGT